MRRHPINPIFYKRNGTSRWRVHTPRDLLSPDLPKDRHFSSLIDAQKHAKFLSGLRTSLASEFHRLSREDQAALMNRFKAERSQQSKTVRQAVGLCLEAKRVSGVRKNSLAALRSALESLCAALGTVNIQNVTAAGIDAWLAFHPQWSPKTRLNNLKYASSLFAWLVKKSFLVKNPCFGVERPKVPFKGVTILPVMDVKNLLWTIQRDDPALLGFVCLVLFGGLRVAESERCLPANIANGVIDIGGEQTKLNVRRCIKITPQLAAWLAVSGVEIGGKDLHKRLKAAATKAGVRLTKNCLRHSFCSFSFQVHGATATARAANNSESILQRNYLGLVSDADAKDFFEILPL